MCLAKAEDNKSVTWWERLLTRRSFIPKLEEEDRNNLDMYAGDGSLVAVEFETSYEYHYYVTVGSVDDQEIDITVHEH